MRKPPQWYTRRSLPEEFRDASVWPQVDLTGLDSPLRELVERRQRAIRAYLEGHAVGLIARECGIERSDLLRYLNRCVALHTDGRIQGWRAVLPYGHVKPYVRLAAPRADSRGQAGAFLRFLTDYPEIRQTLNEAILSNKVPGAIPESRYSHTATYTLFRNLCRRSQIAETHYPLNTKDNGKRAIRRYAYELLEDHLARKAARLGGKNAGVRARTGTGHKGHLDATVPYDLVSLDAHRLNFIGCIGIPTPEGVQLVPMERLHLLLLVEHYSTAVIGYQVAVAREPSARDVIAATIHALEKWQPRTLSLPGLNYPEGAMLPSGALPDAVGLCWNRLLIDNASIHLALATAERLRRRTGCALNFGPVYQWYRRPLIESVFSAIERTGFLRLPNSTGTGPTDPLRPDAAGNAVKYQMLWEDLLDLIDLMLCKCNGTGRVWLGHASPLERLCNGILGARTRWLPRTLPHLPPSVPDLDVVLEIVTIRGNARQGRRPYVQIDGVHYRSAILSNAADLIGRQIRVHIRESDMRTVRAFLPSGEELGTLIAAHGWSHTQHDRTLRKQVLRALSDKALVVEPGTDVVAAFLAALARKALQQQNARRSKRAHISRVATQLARAKQVTGLPVPVTTVPEASETPERPRVPNNTRIPWFVPKTVLRGGSK